jgi:hypothetical protein
MSIGPLDLVGPVFQVAGGVINYFDARKDKKQLHEKLRKSKARLDASKEAFKNLDTSNPYLNMQNVYEDMTVNQQEAEFTRQQQFQNQANILQQLRGAAGASGIAGLAQALANQGALDAQKAAVSIGKQEASIQEKKLGEESKLQGLEREGDLISRQAEASKLGSLMAMDAQEVTAQRLAQQQAKERMAQAFGGVGSGIIDLAAASEV